jgi:hypothetical protein
VAREYERFLLSDLVQQRRSLDHAWTPERVEPEMLPILPVSWQPSRQRNCLSMHGRNCK